jgi:YD repeat-containing protein
MDVVRSNGTTIYGYDNCGRTTSIQGPNGNRTLTWDNEDRLTSFSGAGLPSTAYGYNGVGPEPQSLTHFRPGPTCETGLGLRLRFS